MCLFLATVPHALVNSWRDYYSMLYVGMENGSQFPDIIQSVSDGDTDSFLYRFSQTLDLPPTGGQTGPIFAVFWKQAKAFLFRQDFPQWHDECDF